MAPVRVAVNGKDEALEPGVSLGQLLARRGIDPQSVVVEVNLDIVGRELFSSTFLKEGDTVEILRFVGGG